MEYRGNSGVRYLVDAQKREKFARYSDYALNGNYVARVYSLFERKRRKNPVEEAISASDLYDGEYPIDVLYKGKKFVGYVYEGRPGIDNGDYDSESGSDLSPDKRVLSSSDYSRRVVIIENIVFILTVAILYILLYKFYFAERFGEQIANMVLSEEWARILNDIFVSVKFGGIGVVILGIIADFFTLFIMQKKGADLKYFSIFGALINFLICVLVGYVLMLLLILIGGVATVVSIIVAVFAAIANFFS